MANQSPAIALAQRTRPIEKETDKHYEAELVRRACGGDSQCFGELYERTLDRVYRYIYFRVTDEQTAEDLTSKVFLKAWEGLPRFKAGSSPFIAWLYTIAHNAVIDHYRVSKPTAEMEEAAALQDSEPLPAAQVERRVEAELLRAALRQLTPEQRDVVTMKMLDGMSTEEVAARLRKTTGAIRALQMRGLQTLAKIVQAKRAVDGEHGMPL